jgi:23S rRNA (adenine2503-C2)-methyltransferase
MGCKFCASTLHGLVRNLSAGEILGQVIIANKFLGGKLGEDRKITNIVLMGSGEPLDNYDNVTKFLKLVSNGKAMGVSERNISLSTCGLVENIKRLADDGFCVTLTISLHATTDQKRRELMPIAFKYSISEIMSACRYYFEKTKRRVVFEYVLVKDKNDTFADARALANLTKGLSSHINVIPLNPVDERTLAGSTRQKAEQFVDTLTKLGQSATVRRTLGEDIDGACGQLRQKYLDENGNIN